MLRQSTAVALSAVLAFSPATVAFSAPAVAVGTLSGQVTVEGQPLSGMGLAAVELNTGEIYRTKSDALGNYRLEVAAGEYMLTSLSVAGLGVGKAPSRVVVPAGRVVVASLDLMKLAVAYAAQDPPAAPAGPETFGNITHEKISCLVAGQFPLIEAVIEPAAAVARARVYFKSVLGADYYFVEMTLQDGRTFVGKLPKPKLEASPITYYIQATTTEFGESQTPEISTTVVADESECEGKVAPIGPAGAVTVFSATTAAVAVPVGFAAGGLALGAGALAVGGGLLAGGGLIAATGGSSPSPSPAPSPSPSPAASPSPSPSPTPVPSPSPSPSPTPLPNCTYNETTGDPTNCPCAPAPFVPATVITGQPATARTCADIGK